MKHLHKCTVMLLCAVMLIPGLICTAAQKKIEVFIEPEDILSGETAYLVIRSNDGARNRPLSQMPSVPGIQWQGGMSQSSRVNIINGKRSSTYEVRIPFTAAKKGTYKIPAMNLTNAREKTPEITFTVKENTYTASSASSADGEKSTEKKESLSLDEVTNMGIAVRGKRPFYYLGEEVELDIFVNALRGAQIELAWPRIIFGDPASAVLSDFRKTNAENPNFSGVRRSLRRIGKREYVSYRFATAFRPVSPGKMTVSAEENAVLVVPDERRRRSSSQDDFFDSFWGESFFRRQRRIARNMKSKTLSVEVRNLPPVPQGVHFTGLVGSWKTTVTLSPPPYRVGEPMTVSVRFDSPSSSSLLRVPEFKNEGFRSYAPEVEKNASGAVIRYVLIPSAESDGKKINLKMGPWATFDPVRSKYMTTDLAKALAVGKSSGVILPGNSMPLVVDSASAKTQNVQQEEKRRQTEEVLYLKRSSGGDLTLPLWKNALLKILLVLFAGIIFFLVMVILRLKRSLKNNDPAHLRLLQAKKIKKALLHKLSSADPETLAQNNSGDIAGFLADALDLPPGADLEECSHALQDRYPELSRMLKLLAACAWQPGAKESITVPFRDQLVKLLKKVCVFALILSPFVLPGAEKAQKPSVISNDAQAMAAYDNGHFAQACAYYRNRICADRVSAATLYNLGNCYYKMGRLHLALVCYERAMRLDSRDPDILENLNLVRRKLALKEHYQMNSPKDVMPYLRDMLRLDEWIFMIFVGISTIFAAAGYLLLNGDSRTGRIVISLGICWALLSFCLYMAQVKSVYNPDRAVVTVHTLKVYSLPSEEAGKAELTLRSGQEVHVMERRMEWVRIRSGNTEGWVRSRGIMPLWNPETMKDLASHQ